MDNNTNKIEGKRIRNIIVTVTLVVVVIILLLSFRNCDFVDDIIGKDSETDIGGSQVTETERQTNSSGQILPDYPPIETESGLESILGDNETSAPSNGGGSVTISYTVNFKLHKADKKITFTYRNPSKSNQNVVLVIMVGDVEIARSGIIPPGSQLTSLDVTDEAIEKLIAGGYKAQLVIGFYDPETNEKAMVDTKANITIQVQE